MSDPKKPTKREVKKAIAVLAAQWEDLREQVERLAAGLRPAPEVFVGIDLAAPRQPLFPPIPSAFRRPRNAGQEVAMEIREKLEQRLADVEAAARDARDWLVEVIDLSVDPVDQLELVERAHARLEAMNLGDGDTGDRHTRARTPPFGAGDVVDEAPSIRCWPEVGVIIDGPEGLYLTVDPCDGGDVTCVHIGDVVAWHQASQVARQAHAGVASGHLRPPDEEAGELRQRERLAAEGVDLGPDVERLDRTKPPPGYRSWTYRGAQVGGALYESPDGEQVGPLAAAWTHYEREHEMWVVVHGQRSDQGDDWRMGSAGAFAGEFRTQSDARVAAWAWYWRRVALAAAIDAYGWYDQRSSGPWPRVLKWTDEQVEEVEKWLAWHTTKGQKVSKNPALPEVFRG